MGNPSYTEAPSTTPDSTLPLDAAGDFPELPDPVETIHDLTIWDWYAGQALIARASAQRPGDVLTATELAAQAASWADAMMEVRSKNLQNSETS